jgi:hypothetical protein
VDNTESGPGAGTYSFFFPSGTPFSGKPMCGWSIIDQRFRHLPLN